MPCAPAAHFHFAKCTINGTEPLRRILRLLTRSRQDMRFHPSAPHPPAICYSSGRLPKRPEFTCEHTRCQPAGRFSPSPGKRCTHRPRERDHRSKASPIGFGSSRLSILRKRSIRLARRTPSVATALAAPAGTQAIRQRYSCRQQTPAWIWQRAPHPVSMKSSPCSSATTVLLRR